MILGTGSETDFCAGGTWSAAVCAYRIEVVIQGGYFCFGAIVVFG